MLLLTPLLDASALPLLPATEEAGIEEPPGEPLGVEADSLFDVTDSLLDALGMHRHEP
jgi:hypothetical protein